MYKNILTTVKHSEGKAAQDEKAQEKANQIQKMDEHKIPLEELCFRFQTDLENGITLN